MSQVGTGALRPSSERLCSQDNGHSGGNKRGFDPFRLLSARIEIEGQVFTRARFEFQEPNSVKRKLAAILVADVVGYSRLMELDEAGTLERLRQRRSSVLTPVVRDHHGRIVKVMGDGVLVEFASAIDAVSAALALQQGMAEANAELPQDRKIVMRVGINLGDVIGEDRDVYGETVNVAAKLEALADPGGVCISARVHNEVLRKLDCDFEDMGAQTVKNVAREVRAYHLRPSGTAQATIAPFVAARPA